MHYHHHVAAPGVVILVTPDGSLRPADDEAAERLREHAGKYQLVVDVPGLLLLRSEESGARKTRVLMAGEILTRLTVMEVINVIASANWRGELHVIGPESRRSLTLDQGALKNAWSDHADDRLGEVLYRMGVVSRQELDSVVRAMSPDRRFGQMFVDRGIIDQEQLFTYLQKQAEQIFYNSLLVREGHYVFVIPDENETPSSATVHIPVQGLLMEGVQRIDEMALFRERIPSTQLCPEVKPGAEERKLDPTAQTILAYCDGSRSIQEIARLTGLGTFETTKAIYHLLTGGQIVLRPPVRLDDVRVRQIVSQFNDVMRDIFMAVATYGGIDQTRSTLSAWIQGSGYAPYFGEQVEEDGSIDVRRVIASLKTIDHPHPLEALHQGLHELAAFALFAATTSLPRDQELVLSRDVNRRLKAIRL